MTAGIDNQYERIQRYLGRCAHETPYLVFDMDIAIRQYQRLAAAFDPAQIFYAVKANPEPRLITALARLGSSFDVASTAEIDLCLAQGVPPDTISFSNPAKKSVDIRYACRRGVRAFAFDSEPELRKIAEHAPGAAVYCRLLASGEGAQWPLGIKFGTTTQAAVALMTEAAELGLRPQGVSFHVGSQQLDPACWDRSIMQAAEVFAALRQRGIRLRVLNVGGGFPIPYTSPVPQIDTYAAAIRGFIGRHFGPAMPDLALEPGRYIAAAAGVLRSQVVLVSWRPREQRRWVYLDIGRFGGLAETEDEAIRYRFATRYDDAGTPVGPAAIAGPSCDSVDVLYQRTRYDLPLELSEGDHIDIYGTGAYTATYSSVGFNGFPPLPTFCIGGPANDL